MSKEEQLPYDYPFMSIVLIYNTVFVKYKLPGSIYKLRVYIVSILYHTVIVSIAFLLKMVSILNTITRFALFEYVTIKCSQCSKNFN